MSETTCRREGCPRTDLYGGLGYCAMHHKRVWKGNGPGPAEPFRLPRDVRGCTVDGCDRPHYAKGWCGKHWNAARNHDGDPLAGNQPVSPLLSIPERFALKHEQCGPDECWPWLGKPNASGYGVMKVKGEQHPAHVWAVLLDGREIPEGWTVDHICHNDSGCDLGNACPHRLCVNPGHLEVVTRAENVLRGNCPPAVNARKTLCKRGHDLTDPANIYIRSDGGRTCRACRHLRWEETRT